MLFSGYLGLLTWARVGLFLSHTGSFLNIFRVFWAHLGPFWISAYLGSIRLVWAHLDSLKLI